MARKTNWDHNTKTGSKAAEFSPSAFDQQELVEINTKISEDITNLTSLVESGNIERFQNRRVNEHILGQNLFNEEQEG